MSILIRNATIVTQNARREIIQGDISMEGNRITGIHNRGKGAPLRAETVIDASGRIAMPGLVNSHTHVSMTLMRGYGEDMDLHAWLEKRIWPAEARQTKEEREAAALLAFCEMVKGGTTSFMDMCAFDTKELFDAARKVGIRGSIARSVMDFDDKSCFKKQLEGAKASLGYGDPLVGSSVSAHSAFTCSEELLMKAKELAEKEGKRFQIHVSETRKEIFDILNKRGKYPYEYLDSIGLMDESSVFVHGGWLTKREISLAGKRGLSVASCPISNLKLATGGIAQLAELDEGGANVCLGTDSAASNNSLDMFETLKMASLLQKHHYWKADILPTQRALDFATINGAKAIGSDSGSLGIGKLADIILLERGPNMHPEHDIPANLVYSAGPQNVTDVIIDGKLVVRERRILTVREEDVLVSADRHAGRLPTREIGLGASPKNI